jgi:hypothetical protein
VAETQRERVDAFEKRLIDTEVARIKAVRSGDLSRHNELANANRHAIELADARDLRSLVTRWMLRLGKEAAGPEPSNLFGADAHMIHGVHHKVGECTWPEMQCTGHPPRPDSAPNPSGGEDRG